jgi:hypothetical protein
MLQFRFYVIALFITAALASTLYVGSRHDRSHSQSQDDKELAEIEKHLARSTQIRASLANESKELWKQIDWAPNLDEALRRSAAAAKPLLVLLVASETGDDDATRSSVRLIRSTVLSDASVIAEIRANFIAVEVNTARTGFPKLPALQQWEEPFQTMSDYRQALSTSVVISPDGTQCYGHSGESYPAQFDPGANYAANRYHQFLEHSRDLYLQSKIPSPRQD